MMDGHQKQQTLFPEMTDGAMDKGAQKLETFRDPSFATNKTAPVHRWVPWIAGFSKEFVQDALSKYLKGPGTVLDPFAGVGTTLVEAILAGHNSIGFEINPYAAFACRTKLEAYRVNIGRIEKVIEDFEDFYFNACKCRLEPKSEPPPGFKTRAIFYSPEVLRKVLIAMDYIGQLKTNSLRSLFNLAFASTMISYSNYSYEPSLSSRAAAGKKDVPDFPVGQTILGKMREITNDIGWMKSNLNGHRPMAKIFCESFFGVRSKLSNNHADLIITSPPYLNNYHYNRNTRPHLYWLGYAANPRDFRQLENDNFGKYWQTVREKSRIDLEFELADNEIQECLETLRAKNPEKGIYGGAGWANYAASYFNDCYRFARAAKWVLKRRGTALIVIGNNILQGIMIPTDRYLGKIAEYAGLNLVDIHIPRSTRVGNSIIQSDVRVGKAHKSHSLYEAVVELRKK